MPFNQQNNNRLRAIFGLHEQERSSLAEQNFRSQTLLKEESRPRCKDIQDCVWNWRNFVVIWMPCQLRCLTVHLSSQILPLDCLYKTSSYGKCRLDCAEKLHRDLLSECGNSAPCQTCLIRNKVD